MVEAVPADDVCGDDGDDQDGEKNVDRPEQNDAVITTLPPSTDGTRPMWVQAFL